MRGVQGPRKLLVALLALGAILGLGLLGAQLAPGPRGLVGPGPAGAPKFGPPAGGSAETSLAPRTEGEPRTTTHTVVARFCLVASPSGSGGGEGPGGQLSFWDETAFRRAQRLAASRGEAPPTFASFRRELPVDAMGCVQESVPVGHAISVRPGVDYDPARLDLTVNEPLTVDFVRRPRCLIRARVVDAQGREVDAGSGVLSPGVTTYRTASDRGRMRVTHRGSPRPFRTSGEGLLSFDLPCGSFVEARFDRFDVLSPANGRIEATAETDGELVVQPFQDWRVEVVDEFGEDLGGLRWFADTGEPIHPLNFGTRIDEGYVFIGFPGDRMTGFISARGMQPHQWIPLRERSVRQNPDGTWTSTILLPPVQDEDAREIELARGVAAQIQQARVVTPEGGSQACNVEEDALVCPANVAWASLEVLWSGITATQSWPVPGAPREIATRPASAVRCFELPEGVVGAVSVGGSRAATFPPLEGGVGPEGPFTTCASAPAGQDIWIRVARPGQDDAYGVFPAAWPQGAVVNVEAERQDGEEDGIGPPASGP